MKAERHFAKGEAFERQQAKLDEADDVETIVESCFLAAHHFICAGADWHGQAHPSTHSHGRNPALLKSSGAPSGVELAWGALERLRGGSVYGGKPSTVVAAREARAQLAIIKAWVVAGRP